MELHLEEAAFLWTQWERGLEAPDHTLAEVEVGDERRLLANLDALVLGGRAVAERLLLPTLEGEDAELLRPAALALLNAEDAHWHEQVIERLMRAEGDTAAALLRAMELSGNEALGKALPGLLSRLAPPEQARLLSALRARRIHPGAALPTLLGSEDDTVRAEAIRATSLLPEPGAQVLVQRALADDSPPVRDAALEAGLVLGLREAWARCLQWVKTREGGRLAPWALAVGGSPMELEGLISVLDDPEHRNEVLWALGFSGRRQAAEAALRELRRDGNPLAAGCFAAITGLPLREPFLVEADREAPAEEDEEPPAPAQHQGPWLPGPLPLRGEVHLEVVEQWWTQAREHFEPDWRYLRGRPFTRESLAAELEEGPMRNRPVLLLEVAIRTRGSILVEPRTWTSHQRRQVNGLLNLRPDMLNRTFTALHPR